MRKFLLVTILLYCFFLLNGRVYGVGEKTLSIGAASSWQLLDMTRGVTEVPQIRPQSVLALSGRKPQTLEKASIDLSLSFDEGSPECFADSEGRYDVSVTPDLAAASDPWSRIGAGAALFNGESTLTLKPRSNAAPVQSSAAGQESIGALFAPGSAIRDFSIEFWLYPQSLETGALILSVNSSRSDGRGGFFSERIQCAIVKNRVQWTFGDFFLSPDRGDSKSISLSGPPLLPHKWTKQLIRFDADLGLLEYVVDGRVEALDYTTSSGGEGGDVYTPVIGEDCSLVLGSHFSGMVDEFHVYRGCLEKSSLAKYPRQGGRVETRTLDLGNRNSQVLKIEAFGGRTSNMGGKLQNEYAGNGNLSFADHSELNFFIRSGNDPYLWNNVPWIPVKPGTALPPELRGRYVQIAADFYPSGDGETSPYLAELRVIYNSADPPPPPVQVTAIAKDGAVELSWKASPSREVGGYLIYYGTSSGEYFGQHAILGKTVQVSPVVSASSTEIFSPTEIASPIDAGNRTSIRIDNLKNGTLYYFAVAAYSSAPNGEERNFIPDPGDFSRELAARPLRMTE